MERKEQVAWSHLEREPEQIVQLSLTVDEVVDLTRALGIYRASSMATARKRSLTHDELHAHATLGKIQRQIGQQNGKR